MMQQTNVQSTRGADQTQQAAGREGVANRYITIPDGNGGRTRISLGPTAVTVDNQGTETAPAIATDRTRKDIPDGVVDIVQAGAAMIAFIVVGGPLARAFARRLDKRTVTTSAALPPEVAQRLGAIEQAVDSVAVEVERISEGQRFTTKLLSDRATLESERVS